MPESHEKPSCHESDPARILRQTPTAQPVCCCRSSGGVARKAGQHRREWPPSFWQNQLLFFLQAKSTPCTRVSAPAAQVAAIALLPVHPCTADGKPAAQPPASLADYPIIPCFGATFPVQATKIPGCAKSRELAARSSNCSAIRRAPAPKSPKMARNSQDSLLNSLLSGNPPRRIAPLGWGFRRLRLTPPPPVYMSFFLEPRFVEQRG